MAPVTENASLLWEHEQARSQSASVQEEKMAAKNSSSSEIAEARGCDHTCLLTKREKNDRSEAARAAGVFFCL